MRVHAFVAVLSILLLSTAALAGESSTPLGRTEASGLTLANDGIPKGSRGDVPGLIAYQGTLTDPAGVALDTTLAMTFGIYSDSTGGMAIWTELQPSVDINRGIFNVLLGKVNALPDTVFKDPERWLAVQVGGDEELEPRQRIAAVAYALWSAEADTAGYARGAPAVTDGDWTISGSDIYSTVSGNVGVGKSSPSAKLDVSGAVNTDSVYQIGGQTVLSISGNRNVFVADGAGTNDSGHHGTFVGNWAGHNNQGG